MKQLRFTTTEPHCIFGGNHDLLVSVDNIGTLSDYKTKGDGAYIHGDAEELANFDIPYFLDGDLEQLDLPVDEQDILMILPSGEYQCKSELSYKSMISNKIDKYLITLKK